MSDLAAEGHGGQGHMDTEESFDVDFAQIPPGLWLSLGSAAALCRQMATAPTYRSAMDELEEQYVLRGACASATLSGLARRDEAWRGPASPAAGGDDPVMVLVNAYQHVGERVAAQREPLTRAEIERLHALVLHRSPGDTVSRTGPPADRPRTRTARADVLERLCAWADTPAASRGDEQAVVRGMVGAFLLHAHLLRLRPFAAGNGRLARLVEYRQLLRAGIPAATAQLPVIHHAESRNEYEAVATEASRTGDPLPFLFYAVDGFAAAIRAQMRMVETFQLHVTWQRYVENRLRGTSDALTTRRRALAVALGERQRPAAKEEILDLTPEVREAYHGKGGAVALTRDLTRLEKLNLVERTRNGYRARLEALSSLRGPH